MNHVVYKPLRLSLLRSSILILLLIGLAACNTGEELAAMPQADASSSYIVTVTLQEGDTEASLKAQYDAEILAWTDDQVILQTNTPLIATAALDSATVEEDNASFFSLASEVGFNGSRVWAEGSRVWAEGSRVWADGSFSMMPENTEAWLQIGLDKAYRLAPNLGYGVKVAIIDTGIDLSHPAIINSLAPENEWLDLVDDDTYPQEEGVLGQGAYGHGTLIAGIVRQIAPAATILPIRVLNPAGEGDLSNVVRAIAWAKRQGADVINMSFGADSYSYAVDQAMGYAASEGILMVSSAGNSGDANVVFPANRAKNLVSGYNRLSVTSIDSHDIKSSFASYGYPVEIAAPGEGIFGPAPDMMMASWSGTSMSAPIAAGALALAIGQRPFVNRDSFMQMLQRTAYPFDYHSGNSGMWGQLGDGRIDLAAFLSKFN